MMPGSSATKMLAIFFKNACTGLASYFAFCAALFSAAASVTLSSATPAASPVSWENSVSTLLTLPGPRTICIVSSTTRPITPSSFLIASTSTLPASTTPTRRRVMQAAFAVTLSLPPSSSSSRAASSLSVMSNPFPSLAIPYLPAPQPAATGGHLPREAHPGYSAIAART